MAASVLAPVTLMGSAGALAQSSPGSFSLPEPTPTPTAAPQGPVDVRVGVPIGPRVIPQEQPASPTPTPTPTPSATLAPLPPRVLPPEPTPTPTSAPAPQRSVPASGALPSASTPPASAAPAPGPSISTVEPVLDPIPSYPDGEGSAPIGAGEEWYDVGNIGRDPLDNRADGDPGSSMAGSRAGALATQTQTYALIALGVVLALLAGLGVWFWQRRKAEAHNPPELAAPVLAAGVRQSIAASQMGPQEPRVPVPPAEPVRLDLQMSIASATRSVMMFTVDYQLTINNRSDHAVRDLSVAAQLVCARHGGSNSVHQSAGAPLELIDRIGPHQCRTVSGQVQLPLGQVNAIRQGKTPLFIPLLQVSIAGSGVETGDRSFVLGLPSAASQHRVHPIPLDTPPGGISGLRAQEIKTKVPTPEPAE